MVLMTRYDDQASQENYWTAHASKEELHSYVMNSLDDLHPDLTEPIRKTPVDGILQIPLLFKDMVPPELPTGRVTLLGDAVHPMTPCKHLSRIWLSKMMLTFATSPWRRWEPCDEGRTKFGKVH